MIVVVVVGRTLDLMDGTENAVDEERLRATTKSKEKNLIIVTHGGVLVRCGEIMDADGGQAGRWW